MMQLRQGDVYLIKVDSLPEGLVKRNDNVLVEGETTGHKHRLKTQTLSVYEDGEDMFVDLSKATELVHEEHLPIKVEPGVWKVVRQREYSPSENRRVLD